MLLSKTPLRISAIATIKPIVDKILIKFLFIYKRSLIKFASPNTPRTQ